MKTKSFVVALALTLVLPLALALQAATVRIVQTNAAGDSVMLIDPDTNKVVGEITGIEVNHGAAVAPDGSRFYITNEAESTLDILSSYWWPGNIRELENLIERLVAVSDKEWITDEDLPYELHVARLDTQDHAATENLLERAMSTFERNFIVRALEKSSWNVTATSRALGIPLSTLKFKMDRREIGGQLEPRTAWHFSIGQAF